MIRDYICNCSIESGLQLKTINTFCEILSVVALVLHLVHCSYSLRSVLSTHHDSLSDGKTPQLGRKEGSMGRELGRDRVKTVLKEE